VKKRDLEQAISQRIQTNNNPFQGEWQGGPEPVYSPHTSVTPDCLPCISNGQDSQCKWNLAAYSAYSPREGT
jgi:hypothetical protein